MKNVLLLLLTIILYNYGCKEKTTNPPDEQKPIGYQEDIPWPSLAISPWPMNHHDPQNTGRSNLIGPLLGEIEWEKSPYYTIASVSIGPDSSIFILNSKVAKLYSLSPNGDVKWSYDFARIESQTAPLISADSTIYVCTQWPGELYALTYQGKLKWKFAAEDQIAVLSVNIGLDGTIYFLSVGRQLYAISKEGDLKWKSNKLQVSVGPNQISFSADGKYVYLLGIVPGLIAYNVMTNSVEWVFNKCNNGKDILVDSYNNIYLLAFNDSVNTKKPTLFCIDKNGNLKWEYEHNNNEQNSGAIAGLTIDYNGNSYFAYDTLYSVDYFGMLRFKIALNGYCETPLVCDKYNNIYVIVSNNGGPFKEIISYKSDGNINWRLPIDNTQLVGWSPAITFGQKLIVPSFKSKKIFSIK